MHDPRVLASRNMGRTRHPARKEVLVTSKLSLLQPGSNCRSRRLRQLELHRPLSLFLDHHGPREYLGPVRDVAYSKADEIAAAKLAVDSQVEHGQIADCMRVLKVNSDSPESFGFKGGFWPTSLSLSTLRVCP